MKEYIEKDKIKALLVKILENQLNALPTIIKADIGEEGWISVEDKMPKDCGEDWVLVLAYDGDFECVPSVAEYRRGHWWGHTFCTEGDCIDGKDSPFVVKYWKPITATVSKPITATVSKMIYREFAERVKEMFDFCEKNAMGIIDVDIAKGLVDKALVEMEQEQ